MKDLSKRSVVLKRGIVFVLVICFFHSSLSLPPRGYSNCSLTNGRAIPQVVDFDIVYSFVCNDGYELVGQQMGPCTDNQKQFCQYKACIEDYGRCLHHQHTCKMESHDSCVCDNPTDHSVTKWRCTQIGWVGHYLCGKLYPKINMVIDYSSLPSNDKLYPYGTWATYTCPSQPYQILARRRCTSKGWSDKEPSSNCVVCAELPEYMNMHIEYSSHLYHNVYPYGTLASYICSNQPHYATVLEKRTCTSRGWSGNEPSSLLCADYVWSTPSSPSHLPAPTASATHHMDAEKTLVIVSGTTGAILGTLIILVIIVTCQRRLRYHRMRRARLRCREDQNAFAAYITYNRDARLMLPSYDEAINQQQQGRPPTFDEAVANNQTPSPSTAEPSPPPDFSDDPILVSLDSETASGDDDQAPPSYSSEGRFIRAVRMLFGGRVFTPRAIYCHLVPYVGEENVNRAGPQGQTSRENNGSREPNDGGNEENIGNDNEGVELESPSPETRHLNELLSRAGLC